MRDPRLRPLFVRNALLKIKIAEADGTPDGHFDLGRSVRRLQDWTSHQPPHSTQLETLRDKSYCVTLGSTRLVIPLGDKTL